MQKQFSKSLSIIMSLALVLTVILIFVLQTVRSQMDSRQTELNQIAQAQVKIESNTTAIVELKESLNTESIAKANAFSYMIQQNPAILSSQEKLSEIKALLNVDELHVIDEKGIIKWGSEPSMFGFDCNTNEQTKPFLEGITNKAFTLAQEPQLNATKNILFQYIGVARRDVLGIVQIGLQPQRLEKALKNNEISNVLSGFTVGSNGYVFAVDTASGKFLAHQDTALVAQDAAENGLPKSASSGSGGSGFATVGGKRVFYTTVSYNDMFLGAAIPYSEVYGGRDTLTVVFFLSTGAIFIALIVIIKRMLRKNIVDGLHVICSDLSRIQGGDLDVVVSMRSNIEFIELSDGINGMVASIKEKMGETEQLVQKQGGIFKQVRGVSHSMNSYSNKMRSVSESLSQGVQEQLHSTESLAAAFQDVSGHIGATAERAEEARGLSMQVREKLTVGNHEMNEMVESMAMITEHSNKIGNIIKSIDDIAFQTNILALNAAVEAARAGEAGKGFSVVAEEVRNLASKSARSAKDTADLIDATLGAVQDGSQKASQTASTLSDIIGDAEKSAELVEGITQMAKEQAQLVSQVEQEMEQISTVVHNNSTTAQESADSSQGISAQVDVLERLMRESADS